MTVATQRLSAFRQWRCAKPCGHQLYSAAGSSSKSPAEVAAKPTAHAAPLAAGGPTAASAAAVWAATDPGAGLRCRTVTSSAPGVLYTVDSLPQLGAIAR